jgi:5-hydroxyisourate hydrolase
VSSLSTHVLDAALGRPAAGVAVRLERAGGDADGPLAQASTDADGRVSGLGDDSLPPGTYRLVFEVADYFSATGRQAFYPQVVVVFEITEPSQHYHVPLLLSPFAYSTYRGS